MPIYYFDASDAAATDPNNVWTLEDRLFDGSEATESSVGVQGTTSTNYVMAEGTSALTHYKGIIETVSVRLRAVGDDVGSEVSATVYTDGLAESLGTCTKTATSVVGYGSYTTLATPTGGWTWEKLAALEVKVYCSTYIGGDTVAAYMVQLNVEVTTYPSRIYSVQGFQ